MPVGPLVVCVAAPVGPLWTYGRNSGESPVAGCAISEPVVADVGEVGGEGMDGGTKVGGAAGGTNAGTPGSAVRAETAFTGSRSPSLPGTAVVALFRAASVMNGCAVGCVVEVECWDNPAMSPAEIAAITVPAPPATPAQRRLGG